MPWQTAIAFAAAATLMWVLGWEGAVIGTLTYMIVKGRYVN